MHINQKYVLKIHICRFILKEFTNNPVLFLLFSTLDTALCDKFVSDLRQVSSFPNSNNTAPSIGTIAGRYITTGLFGLWFSRSTPVSSTIKLTTSI
jgi:hypothetical protein